MREIGRRRGQGSVLFPIVFTSAIGLTAEERSDGGLLGRLAYGISQTPRSGSIARSWSDTERSQRTGTCAMAYFRMASSTTCSVPSPTARGAGGG